MPSFNSPFILVTSNHGIDTVDCVMFLQKKRGNRVNLWNSTLLDSYPLFQRDVSVYVRLDYSVFFFKLHSN